MSRVRVVYVGRTRVLYTHGAQERGCTACVRSVLLSGWSGCRAVSAAVRPLCAVGLSGSCQAVTLGPDSDGTPLMSDSAVRLSDTCCQTVRESAVSAVRLSGTVRRCPGFAVRLSLRPGNRPRLSRELRKSGDATHFATDGPAPRRYDGHTPAAVRVCPSLSGVNTPTRSSVTVSPNLRRARRTSTALSVACSSLRQKPGEQLLCCSHTLHS